MCGIIHYTIKLLGGNTVKTFKVTVEKRGYVSGVIEVEAEDSEQAQDAVDAMIASGELQTVDERIEWNGDYEYEDDSFTTTGDID